MFCKNCGQQVDDNAFVCTNCGTILKTVEQPVQPVEQPVQPVYEQPAQPVYQQMAYTQPYAQQYAQPVPKPVVPREPMTEEKKQKLFNIFAYITIGLICATVMFYLFGIGGIYYDISSMYNNSYASYAITDVLNIGGAAYVGFVWSIFGVGSAVVAFVFGLKCKEKDNKLVCVFLLAMMTALFFGGIGLMSL